MRAKQSGGKVTVTLTAAEADALEAELLWARDGDEHSRALWEALSEREGR